MNCPHCQAQNRPGATRCRSCERKLPPTCFSCGTVVEPDIELCQACRTERVPQALGTEDSDAVTAPVEIDPPLPLAERFIGRKAVLERLRRIFVGCRDAKESAFATLAGAPGIGKTRLAREFGRLIHTDF